MYSYDFENLEKLVMEILRQYMPAESMRWVQESSRYANVGNFSQFKIAFSLVSRKVPKIIIQSDHGLQKQINEVLPDFNIDGWSAQQLCRLWLIMKIDPNDKIEYIQHIEDLFSHAEMGELSILYAALPVFAYPEQWRSRCAEGIRSNIGSVLDAIMLNNSYPASYLDEQAWNQLVLKAFFTEKDISSIIGLESRANGRLALALKHYAEERQSAHRQVDDRIWALIELNEKSNQN